MRDEGEGLRLRFQKVIVFVETQTVQRLSIQEDASSEADLGVAVLETAFQDGEHASVQRGDSNRTTGGGHHKQ